MKQAINKKSEASQSASSASELATLQTIFKAIPDLHFILGADGTFLKYLSGRRSDLYLPPKRFLGKRVDAVLPPKIGWQCRQAVRKALKTQASVLLTIRLPIGGVDQYFDVRMFPLDHNRVLGVVQLVTERHQMEEALRIQKNLGTRLAEAGNMKTALSQVLKAVMQIPGMDACGIYLMDSTTGGFYLAAYQGLSARMAKAMAHIEPNTRMAARILYGHTIYDRFQNLNPHRIAARQMKKWRATGVIPVLNEGRVIASLHFCSRTQDEFPPTVRSLFEAIANQIGGVLARLEAQDLMRQSWQHLQTLFNSIHDFIFVLSEGGHVLHANSTVRRLGYTPEELRGRSVLELHPADRHAEAKAILARMAAGREKICSVPLQAKDGTLIPVETQVVQGRWDHQNVLIGISRDITDRQKAEEALTKSEALYRAIVDDQTELICRFLPNGTLTFVNEAYCRYFGKTRAELVGHVFAPLISSEDRSLVSEKIAFLNWKRPTTTYEHRVLDRNGAVRWQQWTDRAIYDDRKQLIEYQSVGRDITALKKTGAELQKAHDELDRQVRERTCSLHKAMENLRESEAQTRALLQAIPDVVLKVRSDTTCIDQHSPDQSQFYLDLSHYVGKKLSKFFPANLLNLYRRHMRLAYRTRKMQVFEYEMPIRGCLRKREARMVVQNLDNILVIVRDITERKKMEREIMGIEEREKQRLGRDLHDSLCQQLLGIAMLSSHLKQKIPFEPKDVLEKLAFEIESLLAEAGSQAHALARGLLPVPDEPTGLLSALSELANNISKLFQIQCRFHYDHAIHLKDSSMTTHLYRIAQEAISNAIRHGHARLIQLSLFRRQNVLHFSIQDNGCGMPSETKRHEGMGLSVMEYRARAIGGTFEVHAAPGQGTVVSCTLSLSGKKDMSTPLQVLVAEAARRKI
jgi:PAS domain S-box-containing protein